MKCVKKLVSVVFFYLQTDIFISLLRTLIMMHTQNWQEKKCGKIFSSSKILTRCLSGEVSAGG